METSEDVPSKHPTDVLIRELIDGKRDAALEEIEQIQQRIARASFNTEDIRIPARFRGLTYERRTLATKEPSWFYHLVSRIVYDEQWAYGTTFDQYLNDLRRASTHSDARLAVYRGRDEYVAATVTSTSAVLDVNRRGAHSLPQLLVVYSADRGIIVTGYQFSNMKYLNMPEAIRWLK